MHPHFVKEEEYALPPLGLLPLLSSEKLSEEMKQVLIMTDRLKTELPEMLAEHKQIVAALEVLVQHATTEHHPEVAEFAEKLMLHAQTEEEVSYTTECESIIDVADIEEFSCPTCGVCFRQVIDGLRTIFQLYN